MNNKTPKEPLKKLNIFDDIVSQGMSAGIIPNQSRYAIDWYRKRASQVKNVSESDLMASDPTRYRQKVEVGRMYMFIYDAKWKKELPYYDQFPLIFPFYWQNNYFLGLNLHYLPPRLRAKLMDALYTIASDTKFDPKTKLKLSYGVLKTTSSLNLYKPCVKKYLKSQVRSRFAAIGTEEWDIALMLPTERFVKSTKQKVWADSQTIINRGRPVNPRKKRQIVNPYQW